MAGSNHHDSETNVHNDSCLHHLTQDEVALVNEQAALDPNDKDLSDAFQQDLEEFMLCNSPLAAMTPPVDVAPDSPSVSVISQDDDDDSTAEPLEDDAIEVIYDQTERLRQANGSPCDIEAIVNHCP
jgi:hypothetical protein